MLISVVIPVYKASQFEKFVESLRRFAMQSGFLLEIILVDDGSTDGSGQLCERLGDKVMHRANRGVSAARNLCLSDYLG